MAVPALTHSNSAPVRPSLLRLQTDEGLIELVRRGDDGAFDVLVGRYRRRLLRFCQHLLRSREDAEDVLQDAFAAAFVAICADDRPIMVRPWLYRIARNRCLNHLRRVKAVGVDSMDHEHADHGQSTADVAYRREQFRLLMGDVKELPEMQRRALLMREMGGLSYERIAEAMDKSVSSVKSLLVRARWRLTEAAEARALTCEEAGAELAEIADGQRVLATPVVLRHLRVCERCGGGQLEAFPEPGQAVRRRVALIPIGVLGWFKRAVLTRSGASTGAGSSAAGAGAAGPALIGGSSSGALLSGGSAALAGKAVAGIAAAVLGAGGALLADTGPSAQSNRSTTLDVAALTAGGADVGPRRLVSPARRDRVRHPRSEPAPAAAAVTAPQTLTSTVATTASTDATTASTSPIAKTPGGRTDTQTDATTIPSRTSVTETSASTDTGASNLDAAAGSEPAGPTDGVPATSTATTLTPTSPTIPATGR